MAEEIIDSLKTPGKIEVENTRALRRRSLGFNSPRSLQNVGSRYLRASTGSCHDLCKHGIKHSFDEKAREPLRRRYVNGLGVSGEQKKDKIVVNPRPPTYTKSLNPSPDNHFCISKTSSSLYKEKVVKNKSSTEDNKNQNHSSHLPSPDTISSRQKPTSSSDGKPNSPWKNRTVLPKQNTSSSQKLSISDPPVIINSVLFPSEKAEVPAEQGSLDANKGKSSVKKSIYLSSHLSSSVNLKLATYKPSITSSKLDEHGKGRRNKSIIKGQNLTTYQAMKDVLALPTTSLPHNRSPVKSKRNGNLKLSAPSKNQNGMSRVRTNTSSSDKTLHANIKTEADNNIESTPDGHVVTLHPSPMLSKWTKSESSKDGDGQADKCISNNNLPAVTGSQPPEEENHNKINTISDEMIPEKTFLATVYMEASVPDNLPSPSPSKLSFSEGRESEADECISDNNEHAEIGSLPPKEETVIKSRAVVSVSDGKQSVPVKLKFRSGKVLDLQSENYSPRRLRFRRARVPMAEHSSSYLRRTVKRVGIDDAAVENRVRISSEKVVLKHQDKFISDNHDHAAFSLPPLGENHNKTMRKKSRGVVSVSEGKHSMPVKLKFRSGKVVDHQSDNYSPRRLKFRTLKKADAAAAADRVEISSEKNFFKHQDIIISDDHEHAANSKLPPVEVNRKKTTRKSGGVVLASEGKHSAPVKLKFRSGEVVNLQSHNHGPRRLKFRRTRVVGAEESNNNYLMRRTLHKVVNNEREKVVLKHQDVQDKKVGQGLFNNVIEETASKLVESRKSKVKALVGAFETVISLQESKLST